MQWKAQPKKWVQSRDLLLEDTLQPNKNSYVDTSQTEKMTNKKEAGHPGLCGYMKMFTFPAIFQPFYAHPGESQIHSPAHVGKLHICWSQGKDRFH